MGSGGRGDFGDLVFKEFLFDALAMFWMDGGAAGMSLPEALIELDFFGVSTEQVFEWATENTNYQDVVDLYTTRWFMKVFQRCETQ